MIKFTLRLNDDDLVEQLDALAHTHGLSRTAYIESLIRRAVAGDFLPMQEGEGLKCISTTGGEIVLIRHHGYVSAGHHNLTEEEARVFESAKLLASPEGGHQWASARMLLEQAGFQVSIV